MTGMVNQMRGKIEVELIGAFPERFLNLCAQNGIAFWSVRKLDETKVRVTMFPQGLKRLQRDAAKAGCEVRVLAKRGVPYFLHRLRGRVALWAGLPVFLIALYIMNQFVWEFEVEGNRTLSDGVILEALAESGVRIGTHRGSIEMTDVKNRMILRLDSLSWIGVNVRGGKATVTVRERVPLPEMVSKDTPSNIVADRDGLILRMDTFSGSPQVQPGQTVKKGQILVSGIVDTVNFGARFTTSQASVQARTWRDITAVTPATAVGKSYTGRSMTRNALVVAGRRINLYSEGSVTYEHYDKITAQSVFKLPGGMLFPVSLVTETYTEYVPETAELSEEACRLSLYGALETMLYESVNRGEVAAMDVAYERRDGLVGARLTAECVEDIALTLEIPEE